MKVREIKNEAKERFALNRYHAMTVYGVVYTLALNIAVLTTALALLNIWAIWYGVVLIFLFLLLSAPFGFGMASFYLKLYRYEKVDAFHIFDGFNKYNLERVIVLRLLKFALWLAFTILLIVPGILFSVRTSMATYLLRANPAMKPKDALRASNRVMKGHSGKYFLLTLSYIGWALMGVATCGLGFIWVAPYFNTAKTVFYKRELQGDKKIYRNPADAEAEAAEKLREQAGEVYTKEQIVWNDETLRQIAPPAESVGALPGSGTSSADDRVAESATPSENGEPQPSINEDKAADVRENDVRTPEQEIEEPPQAQVPPERQSAEPPQVQVPPAPARTNAAFTASAPPQARASTERPRAEGSAVPPRRSSASEPLRSAERAPLPGGRVVADERGDRHMERHRPIYGAGLPEKEENKLEINERGEAPAGESVRERLERLRDERRKNANAAKRNVEIGEDDE